MEAIETSDQFPIAHCSKKMWVMDSVRHVETRHALSLQPTTRKTLNNPQTQSAKLFEMLNQRTPLPLRFS
jgi:hypothetical protein